MNRFVSCWRNAVCSHNPTVCRFVIVQIHRSILTVLTQTQLSILTSYIWVMYLLSSLHDRKSTNARSPTFPRPKTSVIGVVTFTCGSITLFGASWIAKIPKGRSKSINGASKSFLTKSSLLPKSGCFTLNGPSDRRISDWLGRFSV